jgi:hypothetical protein
VAILAVKFNWSEEQILALTAERREGYIDELISMYGDKIQI